MDLVIPYRALGDPGDCIRYALRSAALCLQFDDVYIVGDQRPVTLDPNTYTFIPVKDELGGSRRERNIFTKIGVACMDDGISDDFIYFHDDHFLRWQYDDIPYLYSNKFEGNELYKITVQNTLKVFPDAVNFDVHFPMVFNKDMFLKTVPKLDWKKPYGYCIKTTYCSMNNLGGNACEDFKIRQPFLNTDKLLSYIGDRQWFSVDDKAMNTTMLEALEALYPLKTIFEND